MEISRSKDQAARPIGALLRAESDIQKGEIWSARQRLSSWISNSSDYRSDIVLLLAWVHLQMQDVPQAGRYALLCDLEQAISNFESDTITIKDALISEFAQAIEVYLDTLKHDPQRIAKALPRRIAFEDYPAAVQARLRELKVDSIPARATTKSENSREEALMRFTCLGLIFGTISLFALGIWQFVQLAMTAFEWFVGS